jgi:hypothetical protein
MPPSAHAKTFEGFAALKREMTPLARPATSRQPPPSPIRYSIFMVQWKPIPLTLFAIRYTPYAVRHALRNTLHAIFYSLSTVHDLQLFLFDCPQKIQFTPGRKD